MRDELAVFDGEHLCGTKGSIGHTFMVCIHTENQNQGDFYPFVLLEISVLHEPPLGHLEIKLVYGFRNKKGLGCCSYSPALWFNRCAAPAKLPT